MYLTGTDGAAYNPYAYDSFGNRINPYTGKIQRWYNKLNKNLIRFSPIHRFFNEKCQSQMVGSFLNLMDEPSKSFLLLIFAEQKEALFKKTTIVRENNESTL